MALRTKADIYHRLNQASVSLYGTHEGSPTWEDGANVVLTLWRNEGAGNRSEFEVYLTKDEALAIAHKLISGALYTEGDFLSWWVSGVKPEDPASV